MTDKLFYTRSTKDSYYVATYDQAVSDAQKEAEHSREDRYVFKAIAKVKYPVPEYEVVTL